MIVLDTDVVSELMRAQPSPMLLARLALVPSHLQATTAITLGELAFGAHRVNRPDLYARAMALLRGMRVLPFDRTSAERYGEVRSDLEAVGARLADPDLRIAATVLAHDAVLVSGNTRHFARVTGLRIEDWLHG